MAREHLSNDEFFAQLASLVEKTHQKGHGSIYMTHKRLTFDTSKPSPPTAKVPDDPLWDLHPPNPLPLIVRATDGKSHELNAEGTAKDRTKNSEKVKLSTIVQPEGIEAFFARYAEVCKAGMKGLKRRDRSKRKKKEKGKKKGGGEKAGAEGSKS
ncbi:hypothetical protein B0A55_08515 [Friedmanniomyces simplex]|uniref:Signal recognition particle subunit SRP14 n=1 Tax=Friedmanniomyces simplex TaxID=329884 RepID=A0A4U0X2S5_9PEZI|nr:hypothetical protein B0A55_08515 [Friedmanniomyces simplex]